MSRDTRSSILYLTRSASLSSTTSDVATSDVATSDVATSDVATSDVATSDVATSSCSWYFADGACFFLLI